MRECLRLASKGYGKCFPNPMVGCVLVKDNKIIGSGYHKVYGGNHAEVNAILDCKEKGNNPENSVMFINLEPCSHFGKTPPCTDLIIREKIKEVVIGINDPNPLVSGKGENKLNSAGIKVTKDILKEESKEINNRFFIEHLHKRPYITLKAAQSIDGKIALLNFESKWITSIKTRKYAHKIRSWNDAVLIGYNTAKYDNPTLNVRSIKINKQPVRLVIDRDLKLSGNLNIFNTSQQRTIIIHTSKIASSKNENLEYLYIESLSDRDDWINLLKMLYTKGISSILVEGGAKILSAFMKYNLFDELYIMIAPKVFGKGIQIFSDFEIDSIKNCNELILNKVRKSNNDIIINYLNKKCSQEL